MVNYPYLPFGQYRFELAASNADGNWSNEIAGFDIVVYPPFYRTWWFLILVGLIFFSSLLATYRSRSWYFQREKAKQQEFSRKLINAQEGERQRIASEIHDHLGQQLLVIKNWSSYCLQKARKITDLRTPIEQINETAEVALNEVRMMAKRLIPYHLDKAGVSNTIRYMVKQVDESSEIDFDIDIDNIDGILSNEKDINLYRIVQESLNNILKHSKATEAKVSIKRTESLIKLSVSDNGIGFYQSSDNDNFGFGLHGMTERAKMLNGGFIIQSNQNKGTEITIEIEI
jgi:signal transduction histidine kinase